MKKLLQSKIIRGGLLGLGGFAVIFVLNLTFVGDIFEAFESKTYDWRYRYKLRFLKSDTKIEEIVIIDIDQRSLDRYGRFPWPRLYHARLIDYLSQEGILAIGFDVQFFDPVKDTSEDIELVRATREAGNVYNALAFSMESREVFRYKMESDPFASFGHQIRGGEGFCEYEILEGPFDTLALASAGLGFVNFLPDEDGITRSSPLFIRLGDVSHPSLATRIAIDLLGVQDRIRFHRNNVFLGDELKVPVDSHGRMRINYLGGPKTFRYVSYYDVLEGRLPKGFFRDKVALIGSSAPGLADLKVVPFAGDYPGVEIHASSLYNLLTAEFISSPPGQLGWILTLVLSLLGGVVFLRLRPVRSLVILLFFGLIFILSSQYLFFKTNLCTEVVRPNLTLGLTFLIVIVHRYLTEEREKKKYRGILSYYVAPQVVSDILTDLSKLKLGGTKRELTVLFSDIVGFTTLSERVDPVRLVNFLNDYTTRMTAVIFEHEGTLDKYIGDEIVAIFGAPQMKEGINYAEKACLTALKMQEVSKKISKENRSKGFPELKTGIGVNTGMMVAGNMGSAVRFAYTVIGDAVNLGSRLEGLNRTYGSSIITSEFTRRQTSPEFFTRELDLVRVKGRMKPVRIYELLGYGVPSPQERELISKFSEGIYLYRGREWGPAHSAFEMILQKSPDDGPTKTFVERCKFFQQNPPSPDWDGVWVMQTK
ncbi:MAG: CHASE2 domain-containing protein [Candidatus Zixiibacteriota bacterium]